MSTRTIGLIMLPLAAAGLVWEFNKMRQSMATTKWTRVPCVVSSVESVPEDSQLSGEETFEVRARYSYDVDGRTLNSTKVSNSHCKFLSRAEAAKLTAGIPGSGAFHAYYNPKDPQDAVLVTGQDLANIKQLGIWLLMMAFAIFLVFKR